MATDLFNCMGLVDLTDEMAETLSGGGLGKEGAATLKQIQELVQSLGYSNINQILRDPSVQNLIIQFLQKNGYPNPGSVISAFAKGQNPFDGIEI
jgi:hypothetical protein